MSRKQQQQSNAAATKNQFDDSKQQLHDTAAITKQQDLKARQLQDQQLKQQDITPQKQVLSKDAQRVADTTTARQQQQQQQQGHVTHWKRASRDRIRHHSHPAHHWSFSTHVPSSSTSKDSPNPIPKSLMQFLDHHNLASMSNNKTLVSFAQYLCGAVLSRDPITKHFKWYTPSLLLPNATFYRDIRHVGEFNAANGTEDQQLQPKQQQQQQQQDAKQLELLTHRYKQVWKTQVCDEIKNTNKARLLHRYYPSKSDMMLKTLQCEYFKLLRIVCDSYATFNFYCSTAAINQTEMPLPLQRNFCNIERRQMATNNNNNNNKAAMTTNISKKQQQKSTKATATATAATTTTPTTTTIAYKPFMPSKECITESIYDDIAMANLCCRTNYPTALNLTLHKDYRAARLDWVNTRVLSLECTIQTFLKHNILHQLTRLTTTRLGQRINTRDHCTLRLNDLCPEYDSCLARQFETRLKQNQNKNQQQQQQQEQQSTCADPQKRLQWCTKLESWLNMNANNKNLHTCDMKSNMKYNAMCSLRPIDLWSLRTFIIQTKALAACNQNTTTKAAASSKCPNPCDIRCNKEQFTKDICDQSKKTAYTFQRSALRDYNTACQYHLKTCDRLHCTDLKTAHLLLTSAPWSLYFTNRNFLPNLQRAKSSLQPLPTFWLDLQEFMANNHLFHTHQFIKLNKTNAKRHRQQQQQQTTAQQQQQCGFKLDDKKRRCSTWVTPMTLKQAKRNLRHVFQDRKDATEWFSYLQHNQFLGSLFDESQRLQRQRSRSDSSTGLLDSFIGFIQRKLA